MLRFILDPKINKHILHGVNDVFAVSLKLLLELFMVEF